MPTTTDVNEITFGVEIETSIPYGVVSNIGAHGRGRQVDWLPSGWLADADPSIHRETNHSGVEFVSPVLKGKEGIKQLIEVVKEITRRGGVVNHSCGLHVHVGFNKRNEKRLRRLMSLVANFEKAIYASTGSRLRETGRWCDGFQRYGSLDRVMTERQRTRYFILNTITPKPTVEFRAFAATLDPTRVVGHVLTCIAMVEKTLRTSRESQFIAKPVAPTSPIARKGPGQTALCRLFYALGWVKGREPHAHGDLFDQFTQGEGVTLKAVKKELMRMARQYDNALTP